jgi:16S rRNA processing protein RimM
MPPAAGTGAVPPDLVMMAYVKEPYGLKGWVRLVGFSGDGPGLAGFEEWWVDYGTEAKPDWRQVVPEAKEEHSGALIAKLPGVEDRDAAFALKSRRIAVPKSKFPVSSLADDEYYWADLIGLEVKNRQGESLGRIEGLLDLGPHQVLKLQSRGDSGGGGEILIPFVAKYVDRVDIAAGQVAVDWERDWTG